MDQELIARECLLPISAPRTVDPLRALLRQDRRFAAGLAVTTFLALAVLGAWLHPFEIPNFENDRYHLMAEQLLRGEWPRDVYRPMLYVLLTAGIGACVGDCFVAGKLVSALGAGLLVFATHQLARRAFGRRTACAAALLAAASPVVIRYGVVASTDALSVALSTLCLSAAVRSAQRGGARPAIAAGAFFAMAYWCRYQSITLLPVAALATWLGATHGERLRRLVAFCLTIAVCLLPHMALSWAQFGKPLHDENWRNVALRHFAPTLDFGYLDNNPFDGMLSVLRHDPSRIMLHAADELRGMSDWGLRSLVAGDSGGAMLGTSLLVLAALGAASALAQHLRATMLVLLATCAHLALVALTFFGWERMLFPALPALLALLANALAVGIPRMLGAACNRRARGLVASALPAAAGAALLWAAIPSTSSFAASHPERAIEVARQIASAAGPDVGIVSNYGFLSRHCDGRHHFVWLGDDASTAVATAQLPPGEWNWIIACRSEVDAATWESLAHVPSATLELRIDEPTVRAWRIVR
jgi:4-amino-4-deoxy-L-arabinose transferase-like glycosyltransferase